MSARAPMGYPWSTPVQSGILGPSGFVAGAVDRELALSVSRSGRTPVLAVGSNAAPAVLVDKLGHLLAGQPSTQIVIQVCSVVGLSVGHSAHVSPAGYVAAAPFMSPSQAQASAYSLAWLNPEQLAALDATEPNYDRVALTADVPLTSQRARPGGVFVYRSRHGLLGEGGRAMALTSQASVFEWLQERLSFLALRSAAQQYADPLVRERIRTELIRQEWVVASGLS